MVWWDAFGDGVWDDSTTTLNWTWQTVVPQGTFAERCKKVTATARGFNGLWSTPETLTVQFGLQRPIVMKDIPAGTFTMGSDTSVDFASPPHQVTLSAFKMQETEVTQEQYFVVMDTNPSSDTGSLNPVASVSWYDAVRYCNALSKLSGLDTVYDITTWAADFTKNGYRLPTEAEWEYACRAGSTTEYWWGVDTNGMGASAWWYGNSNYTAHPVATKLANAYGLYDMAGNVWEWCYDWYGSYSSSAQTDPTGPATGTSRMLRGGGWTSTIWNLNAYHSAFHGYHFDPIYHFSYRGFRCVRR